ncbi:MAG TPA: hypothetical protein PKW56_10585, partial [Clostridiales bacterium]|nr:hypothetical protein [Clostridiales bacterium]
GTLKRMNKGVTVADAVKVIGNFSSAGILVHAYMIYGFPGETDSELTESAEILRQMFSAGILQSAYWHRFALTVHSSVFSQTEKYNIEITGKLNNPFANNDISYTDKNGNDPDSFGDGLKKAVYNWMHGAGTDKHIKSWFGFETPVPKIKKDHVLNILNSPFPLPDMNKRIVWLGNQSVLKGKNIVINGLAGEAEYELPGKISMWLKDLTDKASLTNNEEIRLSDAKKSFPESSGITFMQFLCNEIWDDLFEAGLLII